MCEPTMLLMGAMSVMSAVKGFQQQSAAYAQAQQQQEYMNQNYTAQALAAKDAAQANINAITAQQQEVSEAADAEAMERQIEASRERARAVVAAGEAGLGGITPALLERDVMGAAGRDITTIQRNKASQIMQGQRDKQAARRSGTTVGNAPIVNMPTKPSIGGAALEAGLGIGAGYLDYKSTQNSKKLRDK